VSAGSLVGSRTGAVPVKARLQPPPPRTAQTDIPYAALLPASRHGLCDLPAGSAFRHRPIPDPITSEETEPRLGAMPYSTSSSRIRLRRDVDPPPQVLQTDGRRYHAAPASRVVGGNAEQQGPFAPRALPRLLATAGPSATLSPSAHFPGSLVIGPTHSADFAAGRGGFLQLP
jgi:hypothetical protein